MKFRNKKTGEVKDWDFSNWYQAILNPENKEKYECNLNDFIDRVVKFRDEWEDAAAGPLIKDKKIRKAVRAWTEANGFSVFKVYNQHFNYVKIHGVKDRYDPNGSNIEFMGTIAGAEKRAYEINELCGEEEEWSR